jgi:hypothetical protein
MSCFKGWLFRALSAGLFALLAVWPHTALGTVYSVTDRGDAGAGTLRAVITALNGDAAAPHTVNFNLGANSITALSSLPAITRRVLINGDLVNPTVIGGRNAAAGISLLTLGIGSDGSTVTGVALVDAGIALSIFGNGVKVTHCRIGTDWTGHAYRPVSDTGIYVYGAAADIGGATAAERNIIGNFGNGIRLTAPGNRVRGNYIGVGADGNTPLASGSGTAIFASDLAAGNVIGGDRTAGEGNVLAFCYFGVDLETSGNTVAGNIIGFTADQGRLAPLGGYGVYCHGSGPGAGANFIGLPSAGRGNVIGGCAITGVGLNTDGQVVRNNVLAWNSIGVGVWKHGNLIGGNRAAAYESNLITGSDYGMQLNGGWGNVVAGNYFGVTPGGAVITNSVGVVSTGNSGGNLFGGKTVSPGYNPGNLFCGSTTTVYSSNVGLSLEDLGGNTVAGNSFGVLPNGADSPYNAQASMYPLIIQATSSWNWIGGTAPAWSNLIAGGSNSIGLNGPGHIAMLGNTICGFTNTGILLSSGANGGKAAPVVTGAWVDAVQGTAVAGDRVEVFLADRGSGFGGSLRLLGSSTADGAGHWTVPAGAAVNALVCALGTDSQNNTSEFSANVQVTSAVPHFTPTPTPTATATPTPTATAVFTATPTPGAALDFGGRSVLAYPNPGRGKISFAVDLASPARIRVLIFASTGERVAALEGTLAPGGAGLVWDAAGVAPGVYYARILQDGREIKTLKVALLH